MRDNLFKESVLDVLDGVHRGKKHSNDRRRLEQDGRVISDVGMFVSFVTPH